MSTKLEKNENNIAEFSFEIGTEDFEKGMQQAYKKNVKMINIPGFRKGKAPRSLIEKMYGEEIFYEDAINFACPDAYTKAVEELGLEPVDKPEIDVDKIEKNAPVVIKAKVTVKPEVTLGKYKGVEIEKVEYPVSAADVNAKIEEMREKNSRMITVDDRAAKSDDIVNIDFEGFKDGVAFDGGKGENYDLTIGSGSFIPGFEDQIIGASTGDELTVKVTFPKEYQAEELAGADAEFKVKVNAIKVKELPELDDEFAKDVSEFDTFKELKADIKAKLTKEAEDKSNADKENAVIEEACKNMKVEIPECMIQNQLDNIVRDYDMRLSQQGLTLDKYLQMMGMTLDKFKENFKASAENQVKASLLFEAVAKAENIEVSEEEIEAEYQKIADAYKMKIEDVKKYVGSEMKDELLDKKAIKLLVDEAKEKKATKKATKKAEDDGEEKKVAPKKTAAKKTTKKKAEDKEDK